MKPRPEIKVCMKSRALLREHELEERRFALGRRRFLRRHRPPASVEWVMFCLGFALGVGLMLWA